MEKRRTTMYKARATKNKIISCRKRQQGGEQQARGAARLGDEPRGARAVLSVVSGQLPVARGQWSGVGGQ